MAPPPSCAGHAFLPHCQPAARAALFLSLRGLAPELLLAEATTRVLGCFFLKQQIPKGQLLSCGGP